MKLRHSDSPVRSFDRLCHTPFVGAVVGLVSPYLVFRRVNERLDCGSTLSDLEKKDVIDIFAKRGTRDQVKFAFENLSPDLDSQRKLALRWLDLVCFDFAHLCSLSGPLSPGLPLGYLDDSEKSRSTRLFLAFVMKEVDGISMDQSVKILLKSAIADPINYSLRDAFHAK
jgi:hypothetical protein